MAVRSVVLFGDPRLRLATAAVDPDAGDWRQDARDLADTLADLRLRLGFGRALAAPQIGSPHRLIAFDCAFGRFTAVNPEITWRSGERQPVWDDCFSLPGTAIAVLRSRSLSFRCLDEEGEPRRFENLDPGLAELVEHEIDHLDGVLMVDRLAAPGGIIAREMTATAIHPGAAAEAVAAP